MDYLKALSQELKGKIETHNLSNCNFSKNSTRKAVVKDYKGYKVKINDFDDLFEIAIKIESDFLVSINKPERILSCKHLVDSGEFPYKAYTREGEGNPIKNEYYRNFWTAFGLELKLLKL